MNMNETNKVAGHGQHSHEVPTVAGRVVLIRDANHSGTSVWLREGYDAGNGDAFAFVSHDDGEVRYAPRVVLARGLNVHDLSSDDAYGCDLDSPDGLVLLGCEMDLEIDAEWLAGGELLWDSAAE